MTRLAIALAFVMAAAAQAAEGPTVDQIIDKHIAARGGLEKIRAVETLRQKGHVTAGPNQDGVVTRELKRPRKVRWEFKVQGVTSVFASDGTQGWGVDHFKGTGTVQPLAEQLIGEAAEQGDFEGPLVLWKVKGHKVELVGREDVAGRAAYKIKVTLKSGDVRHDYIDVKTYNLVRTDMARQIRGRTVQIQNTFSGFKKTNGLNFPRVVEVQAAGRPNILHIDVQSIEVNPPLSDDRFKMPVPKAASN